MNRKKFERLVYEAIMALSEKTNKALDNVVFIIENKARQKGKGEANIEKNEILLGLYEGVPKTQRGAGYFGILPDKITIFQKPLEELSGGSEIKLKKLIKETVWHEVGHHLGFNEKEIRALEEKKKLNNIQPV